MTNGKNDPEIRQKSNSKFYSHHPGREYNKADKNFAILKNEPKQKKNSCSTYYSFNISFIITIYNFLRIG